MGKLESLNSASIFFNFSLPAQVFIPEHLSLLAKGFGEIGIKRKPTQFHNLIPGDTTMRKDFETGEKQ